jgi:spermidine synthase
LLGLFFASGLAGLMYELLWVRALALVFGNTAQATATTLAVFFLGQAVGQRAAGRRIGGARRPLRVYAALEGAIALSASAYFAIPPLYRALAARAR